MEPFDPGFDIGRASARKVFGAILFCAVPTSGALSDLGRASAQRYPDLGALAPSAARGLPEGGVGVG